MAEARANVSGVSGSKGAAAERGGESTSTPGLGTSQPNFFALTISADTGEIVKMEKVEGAGTRRDLQDDETAGLSAKAAPTLEALIERAFEAGIACMLGAQAQHDEAEESNDEADLRRELLMPLMEGTRAKDSLNRDVLGKAILASAIVQIGATRAAKGRDAAKS